jgi:hypothetical protein
MNFANDLPQRTFKRLHARITQEEAGFRVSVRMHNDPRDANDNAWGVETASSIEMASDMIAGLARQFSIAEKLISIDFAMNNFRDNTRH